MINPTNTVARPDSLPDNLPAPDANRLVGHRDSPASSGPDLALALAEKYCQSLKPGQPRVVRAGPRRPVQHVPRLPQREGRRRRGGRVVAAGPVRRADVRIAPQGARRAGPGPGRHPGGAGEGRPARQGRARVHPGEQARGRRGGAAAGGRPHWRRELGSSEGLRVGICWQENPQHRGDHTRSVRLTRFAALAELPGIRLISIQKGPGREQLAEAAGRFAADDFGARTSDESMADAAALVEALDLVNCVDTAVGHLAGALGRPTWVLVSYNADWRWMRNRSDTPWYPTVRLFRQPKPSDWDAVFAEVREELARMPTSADPAVMVSRAGI